MNKLIVIGAGGHGKVAADIARQIGYKEIAFLDDRENVKRCGSYPVIGKTNLLGSLEGDFFAAIGNPDVRCHFLQRLDAERKNIVTLVHPSAVIGEDVEIGIGTIVAAGAVINPGTVVGKGCIINTCSSVDHDCRIGDFSHVSVGAHIAGTVSIGDRTWIGIGAVVINNIMICDDVLVGAGAAVVKDITEPGTYIGVPAKKKTER